MNSIHQVEPSPIPVGQHMAVIHNYGLFMLTWSILESLIQAAIHRELGCSVEKSVIVTGKLMFNPRVQLLSSLLKLHGDKYAEALNLLNKFEGFAHRNAIVHGLILVGVPDELTFVKYDGGQTAKHSFTAAEFHKHTLALNSRIEKLQQALGIVDSDMQAIANATAAMIPKRKPA